MTSLADLPELVGFFSYSREDDEDSHGALSALRDRIQRDLRGQLGRAKTTFRLWQDKEAIAPGTLWETEIKNAVAQSAFFIPIITPTVVKSSYCKFELETFLAREAALARNDLVFPILYIRVPALEDEARQKGDPVLSIIAERQYVDWREFRYRDINSPEIKEAIGRFCTTICDALSRPWLSPEERQQVEEAAARERVEQERGRAHAEAKRRAEEEERRRQQAEAKRRAEEEERRRQQAEAKRRAEEEERSRQQAEATQAAGESPLRQIERKENEKELQESGATIKVGRIRLLGILITLCGFVFLFIGLIMSSSVAPPYHFDLSLFMLWGSIGLAVIVIGSIVIYRS
jgi:TIR domain